MSSARRHVSESQVCSLSEEHTLYLADGDLDLPWKLLNVCTGCFCVLDLILNEKIWVFFSVQKAHTYIKMPFHPIIFVNPIISPPQRFHRSAGSRKQKDPAVPSSASTSSTWPPCSARAFLMGAVTGTQTASRTIPVAWSTAAHGKVSTDPEPQQLCCHWHNIQGLSLKTTASGVI